MQNMSDAGSERFPEDWRGSGVVPVQGGLVMPIIDVKVMEGVLTDEQKRAIAQGVTDALVDVVGSRARPVTWVVIQDVASGQWTMGGELVTTEGVKALLRGDPVSA